MDLCQDVIDGLSILKGSNRMEGTELIKICRLVSESLTDVQKEESLNHELGDATKKLIAVSIATLYVETARLNIGKAAEVSMMRSMLEEHEVKSEFVGIILQAYEKYDHHNELTSKLNKLRLKRHTDKTSLRLFDAEWCQELIVKSKNDYHPNQINYSISLKTSGDDLTFNCNLQQLQDLVSKVRECAKVIETILESNVKQVNA
ncbi:hypothetical protein HDE_09592 [Halotydeus destructor]|nr:hypothetical protein HDE_09592 [Halotydeus destructor]